MSRLQIENGLLRKFQIVLVVIIFFSSCWHEQWEDRLANGDTGTVTHGPKSTGPDTSKIAGNNSSYSHNCDSFNYSKSAAPDGQCLFETKCASCHNRHSDSADAGLIGVLAKIPSKEWAYAFIRNADALIKNGDGYANKIYAENNKINHPKFPKLTDEEIDAILSYCDAASEEGPVY